MRNLKTNYKVVAIGNIQLRMIKNAQIDGVLAQNRDAIEEIWQNIQEEKGKKLFNGTLLNFIRVDRKGDKIEIIGHFIEYKHFLAQRKQPDLKLGVKPVGVCGIAVLEDNGAKLVMFAKRARTVTEYPGFWELVPSGNIEKEYAGANGVVDCKAQLLTEFAEETGLSRKQVKEISGFAFVLDKSHNIYDIGCKISLQAKRESVMEKFSSKEYLRPVFIDMRELDQFVQLNFDCIVPASIALIEAYRQFQIKYGKKSLDKKTN